MANSFTKQETVLFDKVLEGFEDGLVMSKNIGVFNTEDSMMERASNVVWRPWQYQFTVGDGADATSTGQDLNLLSVPATLGFKKHIRYTLNSTELRDALQDSNAQTEAGKRLASQINTTVLDVIKAQATLTVKRTTAAGASSGFDDVAQIDAIMNERGVPGTDRYIAFNTRDYNGIAKDLAGRGTLTGKPLTAYDKAYVGTVAGFETYKLDTSNRLTAAAGGAGLTMDTRSSASNYHVPSAMTTSGSVAGPTDNRYDQITVSSTTSVAAGDRFTVAGITSVHHESKADTGQLMTFTVISVDSATTMTVSPAMITGQGASTIELQYQNCVVAGSGSATAAIVFLNTTTAGCNYFWYKPAIELLPGHFVAPTGAGAQVMKASTEQGIQLEMSRQYNAVTGKTDMVIRTFYGVCVNNPEAVGLILFGQS
jgi:hypothetical protein